MSVGSPTGLRAQRRWSAAFQPIFDLRDGACRLRGARAAADGSSPEELFAPARAEGRLSRSTASAARRRCATPRAGLGAPFALFLNADAGALELDLPDLPRGSATLIMEITESALTERPEAVLRTLTRCARAAGASRSTTSAPTRARWR